MTTPIPNAEPAADNASGIAGFFKKFTVLRGAMPELWFSFIIKFLVIAAYGLMNSTLVLWMTSDFGLGDKAALGWVAGWSLIMTVFTVLSGSLTDAIGFRSTFFLGTGICVASRLVMCFTTNIYVAIIFGLAPLAIGEALTGPVLVAAVRTYSKTKQRSMSFSLIYAIMNGGFLVANLLFDVLRKRFGEHGHAHVLGADISTYKVLLFASMLMELIIFPMVFFLREGAYATDEGVKIAPKKSSRRHANIFISGWITMKETSVETTRIFAKLLEQPGFYRLLAFLMFIAFLKLVYRQLDYVFPIFGIRMLGTHPTPPIGTLLAINNILILFLTPFVGALTQRFSAYKMVIFGGFISAASIFVMAFPSVLFKPIADSFFGQWLGHSYLSLPSSVTIDPLYVMTAIFIVILSVGEAFYSPRVYEYAAAIAPEGQEASYSALSYVPFLLAKLLTGVFSGTLLNKYCPADGPHHPEMMWLMIGGATTIAPIGLIVLSRFIRIKEAGRTD